MSAAVANEEGMEAATPTRERGRDTGVRWSTALQRKKVPAVMKRPERTNERTEKKRRGKLDRGKTANYFPNSLQ